MNYWVAVVIVGLVVVRRKIWNRLLRDVDWWGTGVEVR